MMSRKSNHIVLGVTGSIAAYKAADIIRRLQDQKFCVSVIMTSGAEKFITPLTLASLSGGKIYRNFLNEDHFFGQMNHIELAQKADVLLIAPATANVIAKLANGLADDLLTCTALATKAPILIAPAMNNVMYQNKIVQRNCRTLNDLGFKFIDPAKGPLACGTFGEGRLADVEDIVRTVKKSIVK